MRGFIPLTVLVLLVTACASAGSAGTSGTSDVITSEELRSVEGVSTAYDAIQRLRPRFLRGRTGTFGTRAAADPLSRSSSAGDGSQVVVYLDGVRLGGVSELRRINADAVQEIRYLNGRDATTKYGTNVGAGVIEVDTR